jgi:TonB family protein
MTPEQQREAAAWRSAVSQRLLARRYFPRDPSRPTPLMSGTATVRFAVSASGAIYTPQVVRSSGEALFDAAALTIVLSASPLPPPPAVLLERDDPVPLQVPMVFVPPGAPPPPR